jgi:hypothetical protein
MCQLLLSGVGYVPTPNVHSDVWDCVESYTIHMLLACRLKITFTFSLKLIISFLVQLQHLLLPSLIVTSSQVRVGVLLPLLSCCISCLGPEGLLQPLTWISNLFQDLKIWFSFKSNLTSAISNFSKLRHLASYVSHHNAMTYDTCPHK